MKWLYSSASMLALTAALLFSGCGSDSDAACAYGVEQDLDQGNYDSVIATLDNNGTCNGALSQTDAWTNLAGAYLGKAGITLTSLVESVLNNTAADPMAALLETFGALATNDGLQNMKNATRVYGYIRALEGFADCNYAAGTASSLVDNSCFYEELANTIETVAIMSAVMGDALEFLTTPVTQGSIDDVNNNGTADELEVTGCAIADANVTGANVPCSSEATIEFTTATDVTFTSGSTSLLLTPKTFAVLDQATGYGDQAYYKLINRNATVPSPVSTSGACDTSFNTCSVVDNAGCYPCPVVVDGTSIESTEAILDAINNGDVAELTANDIEQACLDAGGSCVVDGNLTDAELAEYMTLQ